MCWNFQQKFNIQIIGQFDIHISYCVVFIYLCVWIFSNAQCDVGKLFSKLVTPFTAIKLQALKDVWVKTKRMPFDPCWVVQLTSAPTRRTCLFCCICKILITRTFLHPQVFVDPIILQKRKEFQPAHQRFFNHGSNELTKQGSKARENKHITYIWRDSWGPLYHHHHCHLLYIALP